MDKDDIPKGSAKEAFDNFHKTIEKHGDYGIIAVVSLWVILYIGCMLVLSLLGLIN